ncbi:MAG TPA: TSUP family transporter [Thermoleophilaceae bacterium]
MLAAVAALAGASVQSATGFGFALLLSPALFAAVDPYEAVTALLALGLLLNLLVLADGGLGPVYGRALAPMLLAALPGLLLGAALLAWLSQPVLQVAVGVAVLVAAAVQWQARVRSGRSAAASASAGAAAPVVVQAESTSGGGTLSAVLIGFTSGALTTSVSISGPPIVLWLEARGLRPAEIRASLAVAFLGLNLAGGLVVLATGGARAVDLDVLVPLLVLVLVGHLLGALAFRHLDSRAFSRLALALVAVAGVASIVAGAVAT